MAGGGLPQQAPPNPEVQPRQQRNTPNRGSNEGRFTSRNTLLRGSYQNACAAKEAAPVLNQVGSAARCQWGGAAKRGIPDPPNSNRDHHQLRSVLDQSAMLVQ